MLCIRSRCGRPPARTSAASRPSPPPPPWYTSQAVSCQRPTIVGLLGCQRFTLGQSPKDPSEDSVAVVLESLRGIRSLSLRAGVQTVSGLARMPREVLRAMTPAPREVEPALQQAAAAAVVRTPLHPFQGRRTVPVPVPMLCLCSCSAGSVLDLVWHDMVVARLCLLCHEPRWLQQEVGRRLRSQRATPLPKPPRPRSPRGGCRGGGGGRLAAAHFPTVLQAARNAAADARSNLIL